jgi:hypothetical protein
MNKDNVILLEKARSMCLLYGVACLVAALISFVLWNEQGLGSLLLVVAILGFWRISHKVRGVIASEQPQYFKSTAHNKDAHGR